MVYIVGLGPGAREYILPKAIDVMENSHVVVGFKRALESINFIKGTKKEVQKLKELLEFIEGNKEKNISVIASGDPLFYGITDYLNKNFTGDIQVVPGISSFQYMMAKINKSWNKAYLSSLHGRREEFIKKVEENVLSIWLTDKENNPKSLCEELLLKDKNYIVYVGENLSYKDEKIVKGYPEDILKETFEDLNVVVIERIK